MAAEKRTAELTTAKVGRTRSAIAVRVRGRGTDIEVTVARALRNMGVSYQKNVSALPGSPDFANRRARWAVFVHGCFWHQHPGCSRATIPKTNSEFWRAKLNRNRERDAESIVKLRSKCFRIAIIWGCEVEMAEQILRPVVIGGP
jgi:DNA mismatch endonuclease Vsr